VRIESLMTLVLASPRGALGAVAALAVTLLMPAAPGSAALPPEAAPFRLAPAAEARVVEEAARVEAVLGQLEKAALPEYLKELPAQLRRSLETAKGAQAAVLKLHRLRSAVVGAEALRFRVERRAAHESPEAVAALAAERRPRISATGSRGSRAGGGRPLLLVALAEAAENRAQKLAAAAAPYARAGSDGLYYLGEAEGELLYRDLVDAVAGLTPAAGESAPDREALAAALGALETETLAAFAADPAGRAMIPVSARLKEAQELVDQGRLEAAALTLLDARLVLSRQLKEGPPSAESSAALGATSPPAPLANPPAASLLAPYLASAAEDASGATAWIVANRLLPLHATFARSQP
jgi:hypothetical protein